MHNNTIMKNKKNKMSSHIGSVSSPKMSQPLLHSVQIRAEHLLVTVVTELYRLRVVQQ